MKLNILIFFTVPLVQHLHEASNSSAQLSSVSGRTPRCLPLHLFSAGGFGGWGGGFRRALLLLPGEVFGSCLTILRRLSGSLPPAGVVIVLQPVLGGEESTTWLSGSGRSPTFERVRVSSAYDEPGTGRRHGSARTQHRPRQNLFQAQHGPARKKFARVCLCQLQKSSANSSMQQGQAADPRAGQGHAEGRKRFLSQPLGLTLPVAMPILAQGS